MTLPLVFLVIEALMLLAFSRGGMLNSRYIPALLFASFLHLLLIHFSLLFNHSIDLFDHLDYLKYVYEHFAMPDPTGWRLQQPPLYYYYLAICLSILDWFDRYDPISDLRYFSHLLYVIYAVYAIRIVEAQKLPTPLKIFCALALVFWPSIQFSAVRINNDTGFFLFYAMMFFHLQRWFQLKANGDLAAALLCASLSLLCKGTGILSFATIAPVWLYAVGIDRQPLRDFFSKERVLWLAYAVVLGALAIYFGRIALYNATHGESIKYFANLADSYGGQKPTLTYFFSFDWNIYLSDFGYPNWDERPFWNTFLTAQIYNYCLEPLRLIDREILSISYLFLFIIGCLSSLRWFWTKNREQFVNMVAIFVLIAGVILQRSITLDGHMASGRYIYPMIIMMMIEYTRLIAASLASRHRVLAYILIGNSLLYMCMSVIAWLRL